jgi:DNA-binding FadR family transcriptional regulator
VSVFIDLYKTDKISIRELTQARLTIEPEIARLAANNITPEYAERLRKALEIEALPSTSIEEDVERKQVVHTILAEMCGNRFFEGLAKAAMGILKSLVEYLQLDYLHPEQAHVDVVDAVIAGDSEAAAKAMRIHSEALDQILAQINGDHKKNQDANE